MIRRGAGAAKAHSRQLCPWRQTVLTLAQRAAGEKLLYVPTEEPNMRQQRGTWALVLALAWSASATAEEIRGVVVRVDLSRKELQIEGRSLGKRGLALSFALGKDTRVRLRPRRRYTDRTDPRPPRPHHLRRAGRQPPGPGGARVLGIRPVPRGRTMPATSDKDSVAGVLQRVSYAERELVLTGRAQGPETETVIAVPKDVRVTQDGKVIPFDELKDGRQAVVHTHRRGGQLLARSIQVGGAARGSRARQSPGPTASSVEDSRSGSGDGGRSGQRTAAAEEASEVTVSGAVRSSVAAGFSPAEHSGGERCAGLRLRGLRRQEPRPPPLNDAPDEATQQSGSDERPIQRHHALHPGSVPPHYCGEDTPPRLRMAKSPRYCGKWRSSRARA